MWSKVKKALMYTSLSLSALLIVFFLYFFKYDKSKDWLVDQYGLKESQFIHVADMDIHYTLEGQGDETIVLIHGTGASLHTWQEWVSSLKHDYQVLRFDLPGFGLTGAHAKGDYSIEAYSALVDSLCQELRIDQFILAGNSLGGFISWYYAGTHPDKVSKLILLDPSGNPIAKPAPSVIRLARNPVGQIVLRWCTPRSFVKQSLQEVYANDSLITEDLIDQYYQLTLGPGNRQAFIDRARTPFINHTSLLEKIKAPTLIIWGAEDAWIPLTQAALFKEGISKASLEIMPNTGHVPMEEKPQKSLEIIREWLSQESL